MDITFIGDVHGKRVSYERICQNTKNTTICVGDIGIGFPKIRNPTLTEKDFFIRGNHDNPQACKKLSNYINYGLITDNIFGISGADSIDKHMRTEGLTWWQDEELLEGQMKDCLDRIRTNIPMSIVSHDCPQFLLEKMGLDYPASRTRDFLDTVYDTLDALDYAPRLWIFGHHHKSFKKFVGRTLFVCLNELETFEISL